MTAAYGAEGGVLAVAHRGGAALAAENTVDAFERAIGLGYDYLETDVRVTSDGVPVAFHDRTLQRLVGVRGSVSDLSWQEVRRLRVHGTSSVPRLVDLLAAWPHARWMIDVKQPAALGPLVETLRVARAGRRVCLAGTSDRWLEAARRELGPDVSTALGWRSVTTLLIRGLRPPPAARFVHLPLTLGRRRIPSARLVEQAHALGLRLLVWGVQDATETHRLLDEGVDGIITDTTHVVRDALIARGTWRGSGASLPSTVVAGGS